MASNHAGDGSVAASPVHADPVQRSRKWAPSSLAGFPWLGARTLSVVLAARLRALGAVQALRGRLAAPVTQPSGLVRGLVLPLLAQGRCLLAVLVNNREGHGAATLTALPCDRGLETPNQPSDLHVAACPIDPFPVQRRSKGTPSLAARLPRLAVLTDPRKSAIDLCALGAVPADGRGLAA